MNAYAFLEERRHDRANKSGKRSAEDVTLQEFRGVLVDLGVGERAGRGGN